MYAEWLNTELAGRLLTALGHSLWQGAAVAAGLLAALRLLPARRAQSRYVAGLAALTLLALAPVVTWAVLSGEGASPLVEVAAAPVRVEESSGVSMPVTAISRGPAIEAVNASTPPLPWQSILAVLWVAGVVLGLARMLAAVSGARRLRRLSHLPGGNLAWVTQRAADLGARLGLRQPVRVLVNADLAIPAVCGLLRPVILVPASLITGLPPAHLEAVLAHELAHIRRHDYLVNLLQMTLEALLFFNPFVWWISRQVRLEREAACDALAISATSSAAPADYARVLAAVAERALSTRGRGSAPLLPPLAAPAMSGPLKNGQPDKGQLFERVRRVLRPGDRPGLRLSWPAALVFLAVSFVVLAALRFTAGAAVDLLTPEQRIERVSELRQEYPQYELDQVAERDPARPERREITLKGRITTSDGGPLPERVIMNYKSQYGTSGRSMSTEYRGAEFSHEIDSGEITILISVQGYALKVEKLGQVHEDRDNIEIVLERGYDAAIRVVDEQGRPVQGASVNAQYALQDMFIVREERTDAEGRLALHGLVYEPIDVQVTAPGFQFGLVKEQRVKAGGDLEVRLAPGRPTTGRVLSAETGQPIIGAKLSLAGISGPLYQMTYGFDGPTLGTTDATGAFSLNTLRDDSQYHIMVSAEGHLGTMMEYVVSAETRDVKLQIAREVLVRAVNLRPEDVDAQGQVRLSYTITQRFPTHSHSRGAAQFKAQAQDGVAEFHVPLISDDLASFQINGYHSGNSQYKLDELKEPIVLDMAARRNEESATAAVPDAPMQAVEIIVKTPPGAPKATGQIGVTFTKGGQRPNRHLGQSGLVVPLVDGIARFEVPAPNTLNFSPEGVNAYWFREPWDTKVPVQTEPVRFEVEAVPAGAIYGTLLDADGEPARGALISVVAAKDHPVLKGNSLGVTVKGSASSDDLSDRFVAGPLPLGGKFFICAHRNATYILSPMIMVDEKKPFHEIQMRFVPGETVRGRLTDTAGTPLRGVSIGLHLETGKEIGFAQTPATTDARGEFTIAGVNRDVPGEYRLTVDNVPGYPDHRQKLEFGKFNELRIPKGLPLRGVLKEAGTGKVIPGGSVHVTLPDMSTGWPNYISALSDTDERGRFHFDNLPPGDWVLRSRSGEEVATPTVKAGSTEEIILEIKLSADSPLKPVD